MTNEKKHRTPQRYVLTVGGDGKVAIKYGDEVVSQQPQPLASILRWLNNAENIRSEPRAPRKPDDPSKEDGAFKRDDAFLWMLCDDDTERNQIWEIYKKIYKEDRYNDGDLKAMGRFLFDKLVGAPAWQAIVDKAKSAGPGGTIELAFQFDKSLLDLHRFNWELMCRGDTFLAAERVAFTRLVELTVKPEDEETGTRGLEQFKRPPKVLFVIGKNHNDDQVRPGAEYFALMRQLEKDGHTIHARVLQLASPLEMRDTITDFHPDLVHFICHGGVGDNGEGEFRGFLELQSKDKNAPVERFAADLLMDLGAGRTLPTIVVLSACHSATLPTSGETRTSGETQKSGETQTWSGAAHTGSLASELVAGGVPIVVGMGGSVSDVACRLFSRRFGQAILAGESLVAATAEGRWTAFVDRTPETIDWALPTLFMGADVKADFVPVECKEGDEDPGAILCARMGVYGIPQYPVFCARYEFFDHFYGLFSGSLDSSCVLVIRTVDDRPGIGRKRLLQELAAQALREGHVPVLVTIRKSASVPTNLTRLAVVFIEAVDQAREAFGLPPRLEGTLLRRLLRAEPYDDLETQMRESPPRDVLADILAHLEGIGDVLTPKQIKRGIHNELDALLEELRRPPAQIGKEGTEGRAVVLLNQVHKYGDAIQPLFSELIDNFGLGHQDEPVPVILCYSKAHLSDATLKEAIEGKGLLLVQEDLEPFRADGEDLLAYQQVMLNPYKKDPLAKDLWAMVRSNSEEIEGETPAFAYNPRANNKVVEWCTAKLRKRIGGIPDLLDKEDMYTIIEFGLGYPPFSTKGDESKFLIPADDDTKLRKLREQK